MSLDKVVFVLALILAVESVAAGTVGVLRDISQLMVLGFMGVIFAAVVMSDVVHSRYLRRIEAKIDELAGGKGKEGEMR